MGNKYLLVEANIIPSNLANLHMPLIKLDSITFDHWAWMPISRKKISLSEIGLKNYIMQMRGSTFALISVERGVHSGYYRMHVVDEIMNPG